MEESGRDSERDGKQGLFWAYGRMLDESVQAGMGKTGRRI